MLQAACELWQVLADLNAGHTRADRPEFAPVFIRRIGLWIERIKVRGTALEVDEDRRLCPPRPGLGSGSPPQIVREREPRRSQSPDPQEVSSADTIARLMHGHERLLSESTLCR